MAQDVRTIPEGFGGTEWKDVTTIHPLALASVLVLGLLVLSLPRRWAILPMLLVACLIPSVQKIVLLGMDFNVLRIMVIFGAIRLLLKKEYIFFYMKSIDKILIMWVLISVVIYTAREGTISAFVNRLGYAFDAVGMYFLFRCLIHNWLDIKTVIFSLIIISIPVMVAFLIENRTGRNLFSVFGGVPEFTMIRDGRLRCQGAFSHPILAGCFWGSLIPLFAARWWKLKNEKHWCIIGIFNSCVIVVCCASSTPLMAVGCAILGGLMFYLRDRMRLVRWSVLAMLLFLHIVMKAPVWHLIARVSAVGGSTSWHRYNLIDQTIRHFQDWWLIGVSSTLSWGVIDITNQYVLEAVRGGLLALVLFIILIGLGFQAVGRACKVSRNKYHLILSWSLGVSLFVHCVNFIGVSYFGQIYIIWYLILSMIGGICPVYQKMENISLPNCGR